jgi:hypothetical protein
MAPARLTHPSESIRYPGDDERGTMGSHFYFGGFTMDIRKTLLAAAMAGAFATPFCAQAANYVVDIDVAPPPPRHEYLAPREGYVVTPGYYRYDADGHQHIWVAGTYERERHGERYVAPEWREEHGHWHFNEGHWDHDK